MHPRREAPPPGFIRLIGLIALFAAGAGARGAEADHDKAIRDDLTRVMQRVVETGGTPGIAVAVVQGDKVVFRGHHGFADKEAGRRVDADTRFYIASTTKSLTALAGALLDARGALAWRERWIVPCQASHFRLRSCPRKSNSAIS